jgi:hypothetical protein
VDNLPAELSAFRKRTASGDGRWLFVSYTV